MGDIQGSLFPEYSPQVSAESNLEEYPLFELKTRHRSKAARTFERTIKGEGDVSLHQVWKVIPSGEYGMPGPVDQDVYLAVLQLLQQRGGMPEDGELKFSLYELRKLLGWSDDSGGAYNQIKDSLLRIATTSVQSKNAFYVAGDRTRLNDTFTIWSVHFSEHESKGVTVRESHMLRFHPIFIRNYLAQYLKGLDADFFWSLKSPFSKRLYRLVDHERKSGLVWHTDVFSLKTQLPLADYQYASQIKRTIQKAHEELTERGFLSGVEYSGKGSVTYNVSREFAQKQKARELSGSPEEMFAIERLIREGVRGNIARDLVAECGATQCNFYLDALPHQQNIGNPGGWLRWAIQNSPELHSPPLYPPRLFPEESGESDNHVGIRPGVPTPFVEAVPDPAASELWNRVLEEATEAINAPSMRVWFEGTVAVGVSADTLSLVAPNEAAREYIENRFKSTLEDCLSHHLCPTATLEIAASPA